MPPWTDRLLRSSGVVWVALSVFALEAALVLVTVRRVPNMLDVAAFAGFVVIPAVMVLTWAWQTARSRQIATLRVQIGRLVDNVISGVLADYGFAPDSAELEEEAVRRVKAETEAEFTKRRYWRHVQQLASGEEVRRRLQLRATDDEKIRSRAEKVILNLLDLMPPLPRMVKRLLNRLYFLLVVAYKRNLISSGKVSPEQLGKWAVLLDRWPEATRAITENPGLVGELERAARQEDVFAQACAQCTLPLASDLDDLRKFFRTEHRLAEAAYHLVYLDADARARTRAGHVADGPTAPAHNGRRDEQASVVS